MTNHTIKQALLSRHGENDTICVSAYKLVNGKVAVAERFVVGVEAAAAMIERNYEREDIGAIWTNIQRLKPGSEQRKKGETVEAYTNIVVDIDRKWKMIHEDGSLCKHTSKERKELQCGGFKANATDAEREVLLGIAEEINGFLKPFNDVVFADSGNGYHISQQCCGSLGEPLSPERGKELYSRLLALLKSKFESPDLNVEIDASLADDTQVVTVWGTWNRKYPDILERPQRQSKVLLMPSLPAKPVSEWDIEMLLLENGEQPKPDGEAPRRVVSISQKADPEWLENHGVPDLIDFWAPLGIAYEEQPYEKQGETHHPIAPCPCHEREDFHEHSHPRDCEIIEFADGGVDISCFSGELNLGQVIKKMNTLRGENYPHKVWAEETDEQVAEAFGVEDATKESEPEAKQEPAKKRGLRKMPESCMWGYLGDVARKLQAPLGFAYPAVLAVYAGRHGVMRTKGTRTNLFVGLLGDIHAGKGRTAKRAMHVVAGNELSKEYTSWGASDAALVEMLGGKADDKIRPEERIGRPVLAFEDEMIDAMNKMDIKGSSLANKLNTLFGMDRIEHRVKGKPHVAHAQLSLLGALTVKDPAAFTEIWGKNTVTGLWDRFIFGIAPKGWEWDDQWEEQEYVVPELREPASVRMTQEALDMKKAWVSVDRVNRERLGELALRVAVITTAAQGERDKTDWKAPVTEDCMRAALKFMEWQEAIRERYKPSEADTPGGKLAELIAETFMRIKDEAGNYAWASWRAVYRKHNWQRKDGKAMQVQRDALVEAGILEVEWEAVLDKQGKETGQRKKTGNYRYSDGLE